MHPQTISDYTHLHVHTQYSLLDGAIRLDDLFRQCQQCGMTSVAITDHGNLFGVLDFYSKAIKAGIKPIIGCEFYVTAGSRFDKNRSQASKRSTYHLVLLAMNKIGYENLIKLSSLSYLEGFYYRPRIDYQLLEQYNEGLIVLTGCLQGEIPSLILENSIEKARSRALYLRMVFGDRLYLELQKNGLQEQQTVNTGLLLLAKELKIPLVATNDCHYLTKKDALAHEILLCIKTKKKFSDPDRFRFSTCDLYFKSTEEMVASFHDSPEAIANTREIVERCNLTLKLDKSFFPVYPLPAKASKSSVLRDLALKGLSERLETTHKEKAVSESKKKIYQDRLTYELSVISRMGYVSYFLIVHDFVSWAKSKGIPVGPGRGSGAGSLVAYSLGITDIDPVQYDLLFERFLNPSRKSLPDLDIDFCQQRRGEVVEYVIRKYGGKEHVAHLLTLGSMKARSVVRDVGRALDISLSKINSIAKSIPADYDMTLDKAVSQSLRLQKIADSSPGNQQLFTIAQRLEGLPRHKSVHPAGILISPVPLIDHIPLCTGKNGEIISQFDMNFAEVSGFIKFDLLGLKTLTVMDLAIKLIRKDFLIQIDLRNIPLNDPHTYDLLQQAETVGVFQLETSGMRELLYELHPERFEDLIALVALYRPGPLQSGMKDQYLKARAGDKITHEIPELGAILAETHGVILYQEQVMQIAHEVARYTMGDADILRRAISKKNQDMMDAEKEKFIAGSSRNNIPEEKALLLFDQMAMFAKYGFNKSHSAAYALLSYQTAYLKTHYPVQFMAALLSCDCANKQKHEKYLQECKGREIPILAADINTSDKKYTTAGSAIRSGLSGIPHVGEAAIEAIISERDKNGPYMSAVNFQQRINRRKVNIRVQKNLQAAGVFNFETNPRSKEKNQAAPHQKPDHRQLPLFEMLPKGGPKTRDR